MFDDKLRQHIFAGVIIIALMILGGRLAFLQLVEGEVYRGQSDENSLHPRRLHAARGLLYDRKGTLLVDNQPMYSLTITPSYFDESKIPLLASLLGVSDSTVVARLSEAKAWSAYQPSRVFKEIPFNVFSRIQESLFKLDGVDFVLDDKRRYADSLNAAHLTGYVKEISKRQLEKLKPLGYRQGDRLGQAGIERAYETVLRGSEGSRFVLVNVRGQEVEPYRGGEDDIDPTSGYDMHLTIDAKLQALGERLMVNKRGGIVAMDPNTGAILALVSMPDYDPSHLAGQVDLDVWRGLQEDENRPLFNRATLSHQPPGSTFKPFMALAALQEGAINVNTRLSCPGGYRLGNRFFKCMKVHGSLAVQDAIKHSCNSFFYQAMMRMDLNRWARWGNAFGFGTSMETDLPEVATGIMPDSSYFNRMFGVRGWTRGYLVSLGIGQGSVSVSPLQSARYVSAIANGGMLHAPHVVGKMVNKMTGEEITPPVVGESVRIPIKDEYFGYVQEGMRRMVMENNSSVRWADVVAAGKTGTSQNPHGKDHAWFMGYAPFDDPKIAISVFVENGGFGGRVSAPIAGLMMEQFLTDSLGQHPAWVMRAALDGKSEKLNPEDFERWRNVEQAQSQQGELFVPTASDFVGFDRPDPEEETDDPATTGSSATQRRP